MWTADNELSKPWTKAELVTGNRRLYVASDFNGDGNDELVLASGHGVGVKF